VSASSNGRRNGRVDMTLMGIGDSDILGIVDDLSDENGWTTTMAVRWQLGEDPWIPAVGEHRSGVGMRLGWLRRYGWLERGERERVESDDDRGWRWSQSWRLTAMGHALLDDPELNKAVERALGGLNPAQRLRMVRELGEAGRGGAPEIHAALRRQWKRSMQLRS
jgi:hypothetical protein